MADTKLNRNILLQQAEKFNTEFGLPEGLLPAILLKESGANPNAPRGAAGEIGTAQILNEDTIRDIVKFGEKYGVPKGYVELIGGMTMEDMHNPINNMIVAGAYAALQKGRLKTDDPTKIAEAYNAGYSPKLKTKEKPSQYAQDVAGIMTLHNAVPPRKAVKIEVDPTRTSPGAVGVETLPVLEVPRAASIGGIDDAILRVKGTTAGQTPVINRTAENPTGAKQALRALGTGIADIAAAKGYVSPEVQANMAPKMAPPVDVPAIINKPAQAPTGVATVTPQVDADQAATMAQTVSNAPAVTPEKLPWYKEMWNNPSTYDALTRFGLSLAAGKTGNVMQDLANAGLVTQDYLDKLDVQNRTLAVKEATVRAALAKAAKGDTALIEKAMTVIPPIELERAIQSNDPDALPKLFYKYMSSATTAGNLVSGRPTLRYKP